MSLLLYVYKRNEHGDFSCFARFTGTAAVSQTIYDFTMIRKSNCGVDAKKFVKEKYYYEPDIYIKIDVSEKQSSSFAKKIKWNFTKFLIGRNGDSVNKFWLFQEISPPKPLPKANMD
ncbi:unnamed protein product [Wuchereria bancrofti]|uniref:Glutathione peroxidase n=1 Tax=Wuchereria bancrofti TaxID=6293 RepID=A0A3P7FRT3_WUCBA|nr:unnamed protein product [Wuchereria bancrofti]